LKTKALPFTIATACADVRPRTSGSIRVKTTNTEYLKGEQLIKSYKVPKADRFKNDFSVNVAHRCHGLLSTWECWR